MMTMKMARMVAMRMMITKTTIKHLAMMSMHVASSMPKLLARAANTLWTKRIK